MQCDGWEQLQRVWSLHFTSFHHLSLTKNTKSSWLTTVTPFWLQTYPNMTSTSAFTKQDVVVLICSLLLLINRKCNQGFPPLKTESCSSCLMHFHCYFGGRWKQWGRENKAEFPSCNWREAQPSCFAELRKCSKSQSSCSETNCFWGIPCDNSSHSFHSLHSPRWREKKGITTTQ